MNRKHKRRLVKAIYKVQDSPALDEYGTRIFGRPIRGTWKMFRHITRMATANIWGWNNERERASYPEKAAVPTFEEFATFMFHEVAHGWCHFLKDKPSLWNYPTGDEEQVCWDVSKLVCGMLSISYQYELAEMSHQFHRLHLANDMDGLDRLIGKMPERLQP